MTGTDFPSRGWTIRPGPVPPRRIQVFGERASGTNFVKRLIGRNTELIPTESLGWKHGFPHMTAIPRDLAVVCCIRDARDWSLSLHARPWHCPPRMQALAYPDFIRHEWVTVADRARYFPQVADLGGEGTPLQHDRHPLTGRPFANLFALRQAKLAGLLSFFHRDCTLVFCRMEALRDAPEDFLTDLRHAFALPQRDGFRPVVKRLGTKFKPAIADRPEPPVAIAAEDLDFLRSQLDTDLEARLGYRY